MKIAFIGLGEAAGAVIAGWGAARAAAISAYDIKSAEVATATEITARAQRLGIVACGTAREALAEAELVFCTVTADQAVAAARDYAPHLLPGAAWLDLNSCAPGSKRVSEGVIAAAGGRYLDVAVMEPVFPKRHLVPCLLSGPYAEDLAPVLEGLPMQVRVVPGETGRASAIKMIRSVMVKGLEALTAECALAAVAAGVEEEVFASLRDGHPQIDLAPRAVYNFERCLRHGARRAAEMEEVALTLTELGLPNAMSAASVPWQRHLAACDVDPEISGEVGVLARAILDAMDQGAR